jgi:hypothetical protein
MGARGEQLAAQLEQANNDVIATIQGLSDEQWKAVTSEEGWSVGVLAHHIATSHEGISGLVQALGNGAPVPPITMDMINAGNAQHAQQFASVSKDETLDLLRTGGAKAVGVLRGLSDEQFDRSGQLLGGTVTCQQITENILINHPRSHLQSIKKALG